MITTPGWSYYPPLVSWGALAASPASGPRVSKEKEPLWTEALSDTLRSMSEFLMLATSRSPVHWMTSDLAPARERITS